MLYTVQCRHRNVQLEISELETLNYINSLIYEYYQLIDVRHYHWYTYYEMPQLLGIRLLRKLQEDRTLQENEIFQNDVLLTLHDTEVFTYFHRVMSPMSHFQSIDPQITVLDLKKAIRLQIPYFHDIVELSLFFGEVELKDSFTLASFPFRPGDVLLMVPRVRTPKPWQVMNFPFPSPATISALPKSPRTVQLPRHPSMQQLPTGTPITRTTTRMSKKKVLTQTNKTEDRIQTFDSYIQKIRHEDEEKELILTLQGNFQRFSKNPNEFYQINMKVKVTSTIQQIKTKVIDKFPAIRNYHLSFFSGMTKLDDASCIIEVAGGAESSVVLFLKMSEMLASRIEQMYYRPNSSFSFEHCADDSTFQAVVAPPRSPSLGYGYERIFPSKESRYPIPEIVRFLPATCDLFIQFMKNPEDYPTFHPIHRHYPRTSDLTSANSVSAFSEVFNIHNITLTLESGSKIPLTNASLTGYTFCLPLNLPPRRLFHLLISYRDYDYTREIMIPFFTLHCKFDTLPSSLSYHSGDMMVYDPHFHLWPKKVNDGNLKVVRLLVRGKHPVVKSFIPSNDSENRKDLEEIFVINNQEEEIFELPLLFLHPHDCIVKDIKKKLAMLTYKVSLEDIHLYSSCNSTGGGELNDMTPFSQLFDENDAIIDVIYRTSLADFITSCYYVKSALMPSSQSMKRIDVTLPSHHTVTRSSYSAIPLIILPISFTLTIELPDTVRSIADWRSIHATVRECRRDITRLVMVYFDQVKVDGKTSLQMSIEMMSGLEENSFHELTLSYYHLEEEKERVMVIFFKTEVDPQSQFKLPSSVPQVPEKKKRGRKRKIVTEEEEDGDYRDISEGKGRKDKPKMISGVAAQKPVRRSKRAPKKYDQYLTIHSEIDDEELKENDQKLTFLEDSDSEEDEVTLITSQKKRKTTSSK